MRMVIRVDGISYTSKEFSTDDLEALHNVLEKSTEYLWVDLSEGDRLFLKKGALNKCVILMAE